MTYDETLLEIKKLMPEFLCIKIWRNIPALAFQFPLVANYQCSTIARAFADYVNKYSRRLSATTTGVEGIDKKHNHGFAHPKSRGPGFWHEIAVVNNQVYVDLSFRQLDIKSEFPFYANRDQIAQLWRTFSTCYLYEFMNWEPKFMTPQEADAICQDYFEKSKHLAENGLCHGGYEKWQRKPLPVKFPLLTLSPKSPS